VALSLAACSSATPPEAPNASTVACVTVTHDISLVKTTLQSDQKDVKSSMGTPAEASAQANVKADQAKLDALNKRSTECGTSTKDKVAMTKSERNALIKALTVTTISASAECKPDQYGNVAYQIDSLLGVPPRLWPDAPSTPIKATDPTAAREELQLAICKDPNLGSTWLTSTATTFRDKLLIATGIDLLKLVPELKAYTDQSAITTKATTFVPLLNVKTPTTAQVDNAVKQNAAWQQDAAVMNTLLERFAALGIDTRQSIVNYHLTDYALNIHALPTVGVNNKEEKLPALIFALTEKGQCGEIIAFGANVGDKRPELFEAKTCTPPTTTTTTPRCTTNCGTGTPKCTTNCGGTPPCTSCLAPKTGHVPSAGNDPGTRDNGTGQEPPAPAPSGPATAPVPVNTGGNGPVDTGTTLPNQSGTGTSSTPAPVNNGTVTDG
jgi:hypothetical protein